MYRCLILPQNSDRLCFYVFWYSTHDFFESHGIRWSKARAAFSSISLRIFENAAMIFV